MPEGLPNINLLPEFERDSSRKNMLLLVLIGFIFISYIVIAFFYFYTKTNLESVNLEHTEISEEVTLKTTELEELEAGSSSIEQAISFVENYEIPTSSFITELDFLLPNHSYLSEYDYRNGDTSVTVSFETLDKVAEYTTNLTNSDYIVDTKVENIDTFFIGDVVDEETEQFDAIPRYETNFSLVADKEKLKGDFTDDEDVE